MPPLPLEQCLRHFSCLCVHPGSYAESLLTQYLINHLWEFCQIYRFIAVGHRCELIGVQKVKGQDPHMVQ